MIIQIKDVDYEVQNTNDNVTIFNSIGISSIADMKKAINIIRENTPDRTAAIHTRTMCSMIMEWRSHNLLYHIVPDSQQELKYRLKHVDMEKNIKPLFKIAYYIIGIFYI